MTPTDRARRPAMARLVAARGPAVVRRIFGCVFLADGSQWIDGRLVGPPDGTPYAVRCQVAARQGGS